jgi:hypothetical protein
MLKFIARMHRRRLAAKVNTVAKVRGIRIAHPARLVLCRRVAR